MPGEAATPADPVRRLWLPDHAYKALVAAGIETVGQLTELDRERLLLIRGIGPAYADAIEAELERHYLRLGSD